MSARGLLFAAVLAGGCVPPGPAAANAAPASESAAASGRAAGKPAPVSIGADPPAEFARLARVATMIDGVVARHFGQACAQSQGNWRRLIGATGLHESSGFSELRNGNGWGYYHMEAWVALSHLTRMAQNKESEWLSALVVTPELRRRIEDLATEQRARVRTWNREAAEAHPGAGAAASKMRLSYVANLQQRFLLNRARRLGIDRLLRTNHELATTLCAYHYQAAGVGEDIPLGRSLSLAALAKIWAQHYNLVGPAKEHHRANAFVSRNSEPDGRLLQDLLSQPAAGQIARAAAPRLAANGPM